MKGEGFEDLKNWRKLKTRVEWRKRMKGKLGIGLVKNRKKEMPEERKAGALQEWGTGGKTRVYV